MLIETIKHDLKQAMRVKDEIKKDTLRLVMGEVPRLNLKAGESPTDEQIEGIIKKLIKSEITCLEYSGQDESLSEFIQILDAYLPDMMGEEDIKEWIMTNIDILPSNKMQAMGGIMKSLKGKADGNLVKKVLMSL